MEKVDSDKIIPAALRTIAIEVAVLEGLRKGVDEDFCELVRAVFATEGRLVVTGVGKSAIVAQKIVATFNSTGTPALFMHAADAVHGDLGMIRPGDILLCLSKSGDTAEIKVLLPLVKNMGNPVAAMTANRDSWLALQADFLIHTPVPQEADPNNLAPTASTTAQMVMGDALAVALLSLRGFTPADFAQFHPGGMLGKQLYLRVCDLYPRNERPAVHLETGLHETILEMTTRRLGCAVVLDPNGQVAGIVTDGDLRRMLERASNTDFSKISAADVMSARPKSIEDTELAVRALEIMRQHSITQLVVLKNGCYVGIVHLHDLIREGIV